MRRALLIGLAAFWTAVAATGACAAAQDRPGGKLNVVATFSILGDFVKNVGGERVDLSVLVGPGGDIHVYTPAPADARTIAEAQLVVVNGLGLEGWLPRLIKSSGGNAATLIASKGVASRHVDPDANADHGHGHDHGGTDPHAWQAVPNAEIYVANIRDALIAADPAGGAFYRANADRYLAKLAALDAQVRALVAEIPPARRHVISTHEAFGYFAAAYGITFTAPQGISTDAEPSARDVAAIITQIRQQKIPAIFLENITDPRMMQRIAAETGARIGGALYSDSLTAENGDAPTYIDMVLHNIRVLASALSG